MNCTQFQNMLDDYIDCSLSTIQFSHVQSHLKECEQCQESYTQANELLSALRDIPIPPAKLGYKKRVLSFLEENHPKQTKQHNWFYAGFGSAISASFALWLVFSPVSLLSTKTESMNTVNLLVKKQQTIDLVFNLADELPEATLTIELPEKIEIAGYAGKRQLSWKTSLKKGSNRLALPIIGSQEHSGVLIARLTNNGKTKTFRVRINTKHIPTSFLKLNKLTTINT